jgi:transposase InsO family protein
LSRRPSVGNGLLHGRGVDVVWADTIPRAVRDRAEYAQGRDRGNLAPAARGLDDAGRSEPHGSRPAVHERISKTPQRQRRESSAPPFAHSPDLNAFAERFVLSIKSECLERMVPLGESHLRAAVRDFVDHYHGERHHQGLDNELISPAADDVGEAGPIKC